MQAAWFTFRGESSGKMANTRKKRVDFVALPPKAMNLGC